MHTRFLTLCVAAAVSVLPQAAVRAAAAPKAPPASAAAPGSLAQEGAPTQPGTPQRARMKTCNAEAKTKDLHGDDRRKFMSQCLSGKATPQHS
jgi:hypothetical protein